MQNMACKAQLNLQQQQKTSNGGLKNRQRVESNEHNQFEQWRMQLCPAISIRLHACMTQSSSYRSSALLPSTQAITVHQCLRIFDDSAALGLVSFRVGTGIRLINNRCPAVAVFLNADQA
jgi:hypothetical protein